MFALRRVAPALAIAVGLTVLAPPAALAASHTPKPPGPPAVVVFGDSLTVLAQADFASLTAHRFVSEVHATNGYDLPKWADQIALVQSRSLVLALGSNDAALGGAAPWDALLDRLPADQCIVWPKTFAPWPYLTTFDDDMVSVLAAHPNVRVVDWNARVQKHPSWLAPDGIHYTAKGAREYAKELRAAAQLCL